MQPSDLDGKLGRILWDLLQGASSSDVGDPVLAAIDALASALQDQIPHDEMEVGWLDAYLGTSRVTSRASTDGASPDACCGVHGPDRNADQERVLRDQAPVVSDQTLAIPIRLSPSTVGMLSFHNHRRLVYGDQHLGVAQSVAARVGSILELCRLRRLDTVSRRQRDVLTTLGRVIDPAVGLDDILSSIGRALLGMLNLPGCVIYLHEHHRKLTPHAVVGNPTFASPPSEAAPSLADWPRIPSDRPAGAPVGAIRAATLMDWPHPFPGAEVGSHHPSRRVLALPLLALHRLSGLAIFPLDGQRRELADELLAGAMGMAGAAGIAVTYRRLYDRAREKGQVEERNRLAREVHDTLSQGLATIVLQLEALGRSLPADSEARLLAGEIRDVARRSLDEARRAIRGLSPSLLGERSLADALADEVARFERRTAVRSEFIASGAPVLSEERAVALLKVAQEALHNIEKHAGAQRVRVELMSDTDEPRVALMVADDGCGFDRTAAQQRITGFGLSSMRERIRLVGGDVDVFSAAGWGTRVSARVPGSSGATSDPLRETDPTSGAPTRVLIVDDHPLAREGVRRLLVGDAQVIVVGEAADGVEGVEMALALRPDVVLMDLQMPRLGGPGAIRAIRRVWPDARVLVLTTFAQDEHLFEGLQAGALGYLLKDTSRDELIGAIQAVRLGKSAVRPEMAARAFTRLGELAARAQLPEGLTDRELEVIRLAAGGARNKEIAEHLVVSEKTVKGHLTRTYDKLGVTSRTQAIAKARALGLLPLRDLDISQSDDAG
jgi:DNA-binding NarL/FixJ family response regulator/signal transduction histidine kinase